MSEETMSELTMEHQEHRDEATGRTVTFEAARLSVLDAEVERLNKVAEKLGVDGVTYTVVERFQERRTFDQFLQREVSLGTDGWSVGGSYEVNMITVALAGETPRLAGGWSYVGSIEHTADGEYTANMVHGDDAALARYRDAEANCDHCRTVRDRRRTLIVRADDGRVAQVGSSCVKDFLGYHGDPERVVQWADSIRELADDLESESFGGRDQDWGVPTDLFLTVVAAVVRAHGWVPKSSYSGTPTAQLAAYVLGVDRPARGDQELADMVNAVRVTETDKVEADKVREWAAGIAADTDNNYLGNVRTALGSEYVASRHFGIAASAVSARAKDEQRELKRQVEAGERAASEWVGKVGERLTLEVEVRFVRDMGSYSYYGPSRYLVTMVDADGNQVKTFNSGDFGHQAEKGDRAKIKGTVKEHETWEGTKSTMLTRVAVVEWHEEEMS